MDKNRSIATFVSFAGENIGYKHYDYVRANLAELAVSALNQDIKRPPVDRDYQAGAATDDDGNLIYGDDGRLVYNYDYSKQITDEDGKIPVSTSAQYKEYLESFGDEDNSIVEYKISRLNNYEQIREEVQQFLQEIKDQGNPREHPSHIAQGVYNMRTRDGKDLIVRVRDSFNVDSYLNGSAPIEGVPHFEQIIAASYEDGVTVAEKIPGKQVNKLDQEDLSKITDSQISEAIDLLLIAMSKNLGMENKSKNVLYDPEAGFGFIDFSGRLPVRERKSEDRELEYTVGLFVKMLGGYLTANGGKSYVYPKTHEEMSGALEQSKRAIPVLNRIKGILVEKNKTVKYDLTSIIDFFDGEINYYKGNVVNMQNPEWVEKTIKERA